MTAAARAYIRRRKRRLFPDIPQTHLLQGNGSLPIASVDTDAFFGDRDLAVTFQTQIHVFDNSGVHRGLIFELGGATRGCAAWVESDKIGFRAGGAPASGEEAVCVWDAGTELPFPWKPVLTFAARDGEVAMWIDSVLTVWATASGGTFNGAWAGTQNGSFAAAETVSTPSDVVEVIAPAGFSVIRPLSAYYGAVPKEWA